MHVPIASVLGVETEAGTPEDGQSTTQAASACSPALFPACFNSLLAQLPASDCPSLWLGFSVSAMDTPYSTSLLYFSFNLIEVVSFPLCYSLCVVVGA